MIVLYSQYLFFPGGNPAADFQVQIWHHASNQLALLFTDGTGTVPAANPVTTDVDGLASFYAPPGDYSAILAGNMFHIPVDASVVTPVWPGLWVHTQASPSSVWTIAHHFGVKPQVNILVADQFAEADVAHPDNETTTITFGAPISGIAHLRR
jgi:hypothetical protein